MHAIVVTAPLIAFLIIMRAAGENRYVSYSLPLIGELPKGALFDLTVLLVTMVAWSIAAQRTWLRRLLLTALVPAGVFVALFRVVDYYYYHATKSSLNAYVLYGNMNMVQEGIGIVRSAPTGLLVTLLLALHYASYAVSSTYSAFLRRVASRIGAKPGRPAFAVGGAAVLLLVLNAHALAVHPRRFFALTNFSGEYQLLTGLPTVLREKANTRNVAASKPERLYLPASSDDSRPAAGVPTRGGGSRPDIIIITIESFNALYTLPAKELHPALREDIMPYFRSLGAGKAGLQFTNVYSSAAYTFNGIVAVLCSQYTMSEAVWGPGCLPEVLRGHGYEPFEFISINQLRPYRYDNFRTMGLDLTHVFDAVRMRQGKKNIYFDFLTDKELFDFAAGVADSLAHASPRKPMFLHVSTNQMHVPGMFRATTCAPYPFPKELQIDAMTRSMLNTARCTDRDIAQLIAKLKGSGVYDDALVMITADHAFNISFWNHTESELAKIPLFVKFPQSAPVPKIDTAQVAGQIDLAPTILDYLGLRTARAMYGRSLLKGAEPLRRVAGISSSHLLSLATQDGVVFHSRGQVDYGETMARSFQAGDAGAPATDPAVKGELDALFDTVLYFDQNPAAFAEAVRDPNPAARWLAPRPAGARGNRSYGRGGR